MSALSKKPTAEQVLATEHLISHIISDLAIQKQLLDQGPASKSPIGRPAWKATLLIGLLVSFLLTFWAVTPELIEERKYKTYQNDDSTHPFLNPADFTPHQRLLLHIDTKGHSRIETLKILADQNPENPVYFAKHAQVYLNEHKKLPPNFLANARKIDPENAWFTYLAAADAAQKSIRRVHLPHNSSRFYSSTTEKTIPIIADRENADRALQLLKESTQQNQCDDYEVAWMREVIPHLPQESHHQHLVSFSFLLSRHAVFLRDLFELIGLQAATLASETKSSDLHQHSLLAEDCLKKMIRREPGSTFTGLMNYIFAATYHATFSSAYQRIGEAGLAEKHRITHETLKAVRESSRKREILIEGRSIHEVGDYLMSFTLPGGLSFIQQPIAISDAEVKPRRVAEHDRFTVKCALAIFLYLMAAVVTVWISRFWQPFSIRTIANRLGMLLKRKDWAWMISIGVIAPFLTTLFITRATPLGGRQTSLDWFSPNLPTIHHVGLMTLFAILPILAIRWRIQKSLSIHSSKIMTPWIGWTLAGITLAVMMLAVSKTLATPLDRSLDSNLLLFIPAICLLPTLFATFFASPKNRVASGLTCRLLIPIYTVAMIMMLFAAIIAHTSAEYWFKKDKLLRIDVDHPATSVFDYTQNQQIQRELADLLEIPL